MCVCLATNWPGVGKARITRGKRFFGSLSVRYLGVFRWLLVMCFYVEVIQKVYSDFGIKAKAWIKGQRLNGEFSGVSMGFECGASL